ncbi:MAG: dicarboxylate/amino acid:cation symporter, partial [Planctomycetota bacterium]
MAEDATNEAQPEKKSRLALYIVISIVAAIVVALIFPHFGESLEVGGEIFLRLLKMMVVPLVMASVMSGILGMGDVRKLGRPGGYAILYYISTTILAVAVGLVVVNVVRPGIGTVDEQTIESLKGEDGKASPKAKILESLAETSELTKEEVAEVFEELEGGLESEAPSIWTILKNLLLMLFTDNLFSSAAETNLLPLIAFSIIFAGMLTTMGTRVKAITEMIGQVNDALMAFIMLLMKVAPLGIFCLVAARFGRAQAEGKFLEVLSQTGWYVAAVLIGLAVHAFITLPLILWIFTRRNPYRFMYQMSEALLTAFSTASSSATLPITMRCAISKAGVSKRSTEFVLPLGATINMDGTALYEAVAAIFIAQAIGFPLGLLGQVTIAITATLAAIGAAGIPEAGLVTMIIVLNAVGLPVEYISLILAVDWLLDRFRTAVN